MKNVILFLLLFFCLTKSFGQKYYTDKKEYESALKYYNDAKDSYDNYIKKLNYFKNYKFPKSKNYPPDGDSWYAYFKTDLESLGVRFDNNEIRLHKNIPPKDSLYINFIEVNDSPFLLVKVTNKKLSSSEYKFCCKTLCFDYPGKKPIYVEKQVPKKDEIVIIKENKIDSLKVVTINPIEYKIKTLYLMPNGVRYSYENLIKVYPSMSNSKVFSSYFKD